MSASVIAYELLDRVAGESNFLWQYDYGQKMKLTGVELPISYTVHFSNSSRGASIPSIGDASGVSIPDQVLLTGKPVYFWLFLHIGENDGQTAYANIISVHPRANLPEIDPPDPEQQSILDELMAALNAGIEHVDETFESIPDVIDEKLQEAKDSGEFKGDPGAVFTPAIHDGVMSWSNDGGLPNPEPTDFNTELELDNFATKQELAGKVDNGKIGQPNGVAALDETGHVPSELLPSYVDDVVEYPSVSQFPAVGESGKIYISTSNNHWYRWTGSQYFDMTGADASLKADKRDTILETTLSRGRSPGSGIGNGSLAFGNNVVASSDYSVALGNNTIANNYCSYAEGYYSQASGSGAHAEGQNTYSTGEGSHAEGRLTTASGNQSHAEGYYAKAMDVAAHAEGSDSIAYGQNSHAEGFYTKAHTNNSHSEGEFSEAKGNVSHAEGSYTYACGNYSHSEGRQTTAGDDNGGGVASHSEGYYTYAGGDNSHAEGQNTEATGISSHAEGNHTEATEAYAHAEGYQTESSGTAAHAEGSNTTASGNNSHSEGDNTKAIGGCSHAEGGGTQAVGSYSHAEGGGSRATGNGSHAEGGGTTASGDNSHSEGSGTTASGGNSHAEGGGSQAAGNYSHAEGSGTRATGDYSHAEGGGTTATGHDSHAEGGGTQATAACSHAEGASTQANGLDSHAEGAGTQTEGFAAHSEGTGTHADGNSSHAEGYSTLATGSYSHAGGCMNLPDEYDDARWPEWIQGEHCVPGDRRKRTRIVDEETVVEGFVCTVENTDSDWDDTHWDNQYGKMNYAVIVGNGYGNDRSNAYCLDWDGNGHFAGDVYIGCNPDGTGGTKLELVPFATDAETMSIFESA